METNYEKGENLAYQELGRFLNTFEHVTHVFRDIITLILKDNGLQNETYSDIILTRLTAEPIGSIFQAMVAYYYEDDIKMKTLSDSFIKEFRNLIEVRNIIIHCYWIIGVGTNKNEISEISMIGIKKKTSKNGITHYNLNMEILEMKKLNDVSNDFEELCYGLLNKSRRKEKDFEKLITDLNQIKFKPFIEHFNKI